MTITHNHSRVVAHDLERLLQAAQSQTAVNQALITEVDLGPFKHQVDNGIPLRIAAFNFIDNAIEKFPAKTSAPGLVESVIRGLDDPQEEVNVLCMHIIGRLHHLAQSTVLANLDPILDAFEKQFTKHLKNVIDKSKTNEKSQNVVRAMMRVISVLAKNPDIEQNNRFIEMQKTYVLENPISREIYEKLQKTAV
jgi:cullin-associated NEDD8-dissociated protein 1